jgi:hypothetical protein
VRHLGTTHDQPEPTSRALDEFLAHYEEDKENL